MYKTLYTAIVVAMLLASADTADADGSMRCKGQIVGVDTSAAEVLILCGEPQSRLSSEVPIRSGTGAGFSHIVGFTVTEQWIYDRGWGRFPAVLHIDNGRVIRVEFLPRRSGA